MTDEMVSPTNCSNCKDLEKKVVARGLCDTCYNKWRRGDNQLIGLMGGQFTKVQFRKQRVTSTAVRNVERTVSMLRCSVPNFEEIAKELGQLVAKKNNAYGDAFAMTGNFLAILYPNGIRVDQYGDALALVRIFDKQMRIANEKDAFGESPWMDIGGYGILGEYTDRRKKSKPVHGA